MDINIKLKLTEEYYAEIYQESVKSRLKYRKWQPLIIGLNFLFSGFLLWYIIRNSELKSYFILPLIFFFFGLHELYDSINSKKKWLKARKEKGIVNEIITFRFKDHEIEHSGPYSKGVIQWEGFQCIQETAKGLFLIPQKGISIYIPKYCFHDKSDMKLIVDKFKTIPTIKVI